jgi:hypothetical protein
MDDALADYPGGGIYYDCSGGDRCRGTLVAVWPSEDNPTADGSLGPEPLPPWQPPPEGMFPKPAPVAPPEFVPRPPPVAPVASPVPIVPEPLPQPKQRAYPAWNARRDAERAERAELRKLTDTELEDRLGVAYADDSVEGQALADRLEAEFQRRDDARALADAKAAAKAAASEAKLEAQYAEINRLIVEENYGGLEATHAVLGGSWERMERQAMLDYLRENTAVGSDVPFSVAVKDAYHIELNAELERVEAVTRGADLRNPAGVAKNVDVMRLFWTTDSAWARRYAAPELKEYWDGHGRLTMESFQDTLRQAVTGQATKREYGGDYYT